MIKNNINTNESELHIQSIANKLNISRSPIQKKINDGTLKRGKRGYILNNDNARFFIKTHPNYRSNLGFNITSDKEKSEVGKIENQYDQEFFDLDKITLLDMQGMKGDQVSMEFNKARAKILLIELEKKQIELKKYKDSLVDKDKFMEVLNVTVFLYFKAFEPNSTFDLSITNLIKKNIENEKYQDILKTEINKYIFNALNNYKNSIEQLQKNTDINNF